MRWWWEKDELKKRDLHETLRLKFDVKDPKSVENEFLGFARNKLYGMAKDTNKTITLADGTTIFIRSDEWNPKIFIEKPVVVAERKPKEIISPEYEFYIIPLIELTEGESIGSALYKSVGFEVNMPTFTPYAYKEQELNTDYSGTSWGRKSLVPLAKFFRLEKGTDKVFVKELKELDYRGYTGVQLLSIVTNVVTDAPATINNPSKFHTDYTIMYDGQIQKKVTEYFEYFEWFSDDDPLYPRYKYVNATYTGSTMQLYAFPSALAPKHYAYIYTEYINSSDASSFTTLDDWAPGSSPVVATYTGLVNCKTYICVDGRDYLICDETTPCQKPYVPTGWTEPDDMKIGPITQVEDIGIHTFGDGIVVVYAVKRDRYGGATVAVNANGDLLIAPGPRVLYGMIHGKNHYQSKEFEVYPFDDDGEEVNLGNSSIVRHFYPPTKNKIPTLYGHMKIRAGIFKRYILFGKTKTITNPKYL